MSGPIRVLILAAGTGSRLMPYTADRPKCMVPLAGRPLIERQLETLRSCGLTEFVVVGGYKADCLAHLGVRFVVNPDFATTNMVWTMMIAREIFDGQSDVVMAYGDIVYEPRVLRALLDGDGPVVVAADRRWSDLWKLRMETPLDDAETFKLNADGTLAELGEKPRSPDDVQGQYMGLVRFDKDIHADMLALYDRLEAEDGRDDVAFRNMYMTAFIQRMIDAGWPVRTAWTDNGWLEVDTAEDLAIYEQLHRRGELERICALDRTSDQG